MSKVKCAGNLTIEIDDSGGTPRDLTGFAKEIETFGQEYNQVDDTVFSDTAESVIAGIEAGQPFRLRGFWDAATNGPDDVLNDAPGNIRTVKLTVVSGTRSFSAEMLCTANKIIPVLKEYIEFEATFQQDGAVTVST